jgi:hypothetical protein
MSPAGWLGGVPGAGSQGSHSIAIQVRDAQGRSAHATLVLTIREGALAVQPVALPAGTLGAPYGPVALSASGGKSPYTWSAGSALPAGMTLSAAGVLGGTPAAGAAGAHSVSVTVRDSAGASSSLALALTIQLAQQPLKISSPATLPAGSEKAPYEAPFTAAGGTGAYSWSATGLPSGLNMVATGALSGTPAQGARGTYSVQVTVRDSSQATAVITFPLTIHAGLEIASPASLPPATAGSAMIPVAFTATGGTAPYAWSATATPEGVSMSAGGVLAGTPSGAPGVYQILVAVTDSAGATATAKAPLTVLAARPPLSITGPHSLPVALAGSPYGPIFFAAQGGTAPYNWQVAGGSLPGGVTLTAGGQLSGTPASGAAGNYPLTIQTTDAAGATAKVSLAITVQAVLSPLTITTTSLPDGATTNS